MGIKVGRIKNNFFLDFSISFFCDLQTCSVWCTRNAKERISPNPTAVKIRFKKRSSIFSISSYGYPVLVLPTCGIFLMNLFAIPSLSSAVWVSNVFHSPKIAGASPPRLGISFKTLPSLSYPSSEDCLTYCVHQTNDVVIINVCYADFDFRRRR